ncbi:Hypothetical Protein FCC1311_101592 [Hondaea fermentalgiana]|uniref:Major facilitator superfamily associated domain-containing protein n=1 Tax=Hondaea fermentalgiana TaxID=2315210 RepID=A0A2R5GST6_9STRA|nr:Hypothetical Protein FCC1311_101592 [Hondaea fermentalgiana]|eukprot:GBG33936.1 Hypothetical Protein FCC1311_101592 [Hondaea fermentalgiana]
MRSIKDVLLARDEALRPRWVYLMGYWLLAAQGRFFVLLLSELGLEEPEIGVVLSVSRLLNVLAPMAWGILADRVLGLEVTMMLSVGTALCAFSMYAVPRFEHFLAVMMVRSAHSVFLSGLESNLNAYCLAHVDAPLGTAKEDLPMARKKLYGRERAFGAVARALSNLLLGVLFDVTGSYKVMVLYYACISVIFIGILGLSVARRVWSDARGYEPIQDDNIEIEMTEAVTLDGEANKDQDFVAGAKAFQQPDAHSQDVEEKAGLESAATCIGLVQNLSFLFFRDTIGSSNLILALSICTTVLFEIPIFAFAKSLLEHFSPAALFFIALVSYTVRVVAYTLIPEGDGAFILLCEPLHGVTVALGQLSAVLIVSDIAPEGLESFAQGSLLAFKYLGASLGLLIGSDAMKAYGTVLTYPALAASTLAVLLGAAATSTLAKTEEQPQEQQQQKQQNSGSDEEEGEDATQKSPFMYPELEKGIKVREARERELLDLRARARNRIFLLQERVGRGELSEREYRMEIHKLKEAVNRDAQRLIFGVSPEQAHARDEYLQAYGCVKWSEQAMQKIAALGPIVELGAGYGQWRQELAQQHKVDIIAYDDYSQLYLPSEKAREETGVLEGNETVLRKHRDRTLLLVCPPPNEMASKCMSAYRGDRLVYVGEGRGGAHADSDFFNTLESKWEVEEIIDVLPFSECYEKCFILKRKPRGWFGFLWG